jgi:DNA polymerase III delta prime subunit
MKRFVEERPTCLKDVVLPPVLRALFEKYIETLKIPHLLLVGTQGCGKTTLARVLSKELNAKTLEINASKENGIDVIREKLENFCKTPNVEAIFDLDNNSKGFMKKIVILDEFDYTTPAFKEAFKSFIETYEDNVVFIVTGNNITSLTAPLMSRFKSGYINFDVIFGSMSESESKMFRTELKQYIVFKVQTQSVEYDDNTIDEILESYFPDFRSVLNECERTIDENGNLKSYKANLKYDVKSYFTMPLKKLVTECEKIDNKNIFYKNMIEYILDIEDENAYLIVTRMIEKLKSNYSKSGLTNLVILVKKILSQVK